MAQQASTVKLATRCSPLKVEELLFSRIVVLSPFFRSRTPNKMTQNKLESEVKRGQLETRFLTVNKHTQNSEKRFERECHRFLIRFFFLVRSFCMNDCDSAFGGFALLKKISLGNDFTDCKLENEWFRSAFSQVWVKRRDVNF